MIVLRSKRLAPYVDKLAWYGDGAGEPFTVYPDLYPVMGFQAVGRTSLVNGGQPEPLTSAGVTGIHRLPKTFRNTAAFSSVLVYFKPEALYGWKLFSPKEIAESSVALADCGISRAVLERLPELQANDPREFLAYMEESIWQLVKDIPIDPWAEWAVNRIRQTNGSVRVGELAEESTLGRRQFERRFAERIGIPPKTLGQIAKFRHVLRALPSSDSLTRIAHDADYFDQSHLIKEIRKRTGLTPGQLHAAEKFRISP
ncbi:helix-turn-helix domain-containing protein [Cohnella sp. GCM10027633]|uniref:helix-turn-helix domain-containing protein n=1 Tax=unclassified Cohnella TaxID=2636738 RepID=UPI00362F3217